MTNPIYQVDAFTNQPFKGNPAAVCLLTQPEPDDWMMAVAAEMNLSETAFLLKEQEAYRLRWFTPKTEVKLCGHATLASAHVLWESGLLAAHEAALFDTLSGRLTATKRGDWIEMDFPTRIQEPAEPIEGLLEALGVVRAQFVGKHVATYLIEVASEAEVRDLQPDFHLLAKLAVRSVIVTARSETAEFDFVSRYFAPAVGINEDPVTGSAHCHLAPYWGKKLGKSEMTGYQASARGGVVRVRNTGERVMLCGQAVTVLVGELR